jgi:hypothetical protein
VNEHDRNRKFTDKSAAVANEAVAEGKAVQSNPRGRLNKAIRPRLKTCEATISK